METSKLFVALSHTLTQSQIDGFKSQYGTQTSLSYEDIEEMGLQEAYELPYKFVAEITTLKEVAPELQSQMSNIPATATLAEIQQLAKAIVAEAVKVGATHFCLQGEPCLQIWSNNYASGKFGLIDFGALCDKLGCKFSSSMVCVQSKTERKSVETHNADGAVTKTATFEHKMWREMF